MHRKHIPELQSSGTCLSHPRRWNLVTWPANGKGSENVASLCKHTLSCCSVPMRGEEDRKHGVPSPSITDNPFLPGREHQTRVSINHISLGQCFWRAHTEHSGFPSLGFSSSAGPQEPSNAAFTSALSILSKSVQPNKPLKPLPFIHYPSPFQIALRSLLAHLDFPTAKNLS